MPEQRGFKAVVDEIHALFPEMSRSKIRRLLQAHNAPVSTWQMELRGYFLMHCDPTGEQATN